MTNCIIYVVADILEIEKNIHLENEKLNQKTVAQRGAIDYYKKEIN